MSCSNKVKSACPESIYVSLVPGNPALWNGIFFVHTGPGTPLQISHSLLIVSAGPFASAILRFHVGIPSSLDRPPAITFQTDVFHPLVTPVTAHSYTPGTLDTQLGKSRVDHQLAPGEMSLRPGFPLWYPGEEQSAGSGRGGRKTGTVLENTMSTALEESCKHPVSADSQAVLLQNGALQNQGAEKFDMVKVLEYVQSAFQDEGFLDSLPIDMAVDTGAWKAWQAHRGINKPTPEPPNISGNASSPLIHQRTGSVVRARTKAPKTPGEWSWEGVWVDRVARNVDASISKPVLYGGHEDDMVGLSLPTILQSFLVNTGMKDFFAFSRF